MKIFFMKSGKFLSLHCTQLPICRFKKFIKRS